MTPSFLALPIAAAIALSLSACGRDPDRATTATNPQLPPRTAQAPVNPDRPPAGKALNPDTKDPSIPNNPANTDRAVKDSAPPPGTGEPPKTKPEG